jgi:hypothetical protein
MNPGGTFSVSDDMVINVTEVDENGLSQKDIYGYDIVLLANVMRIPSGKIETLKSYLDEGGTVLVSAGELLDNDFYNTFLFSEGKGIMPCLLGKAGKKKEGLASWVTLDTRTLKGPILSFLGKFKSNIAENIHFYKYFSIPETDDDPFTAVIRFSDGTPAVTVREEAGLSCFLNFTLDEKWCSFPSHPLYLPFFREIINYSVRRGQTRFTGFAGESITARLPAESAGGTFAVTGPDISADGIKPLFAKTRYIIGWEKTDLPGFYRVTGQGYEEVFARNHRPSESSIETVNERAFRDDFPEILLEITGRNRMLSGLEGQGRNIWRFLAVAAFILFIAEFLFSFYQSRK